MSKAWVLIYFISTFGCANIKVDSRKGQSPIDFTALREIRLPLGHSLLNEPAFQAEPYSWGDSILLVGQLLPVGKLDSMWFASNNYHFPSDSSTTKGYRTHLDKLPRKAISAIKDGVDYYEDLIYSKDLVAMQYFVLGMDTVVLLNDIGKYPIPDREGTSYFKYTIAATVKNKLPNDFLLMSYQVLQLYAEPGRYFWVEDKSIRTVDIEFGEENVLLGHIDYMVINHEFVRKR